MVESNFPVEQLAKAPQHKPMQERSSCDETLEEILNPFKAMETRNPPGVYFLRAAVLGTILDALARFNLGHWINTMLDFVVSVARAGIPNPAEWPSRHILSPRAPTAMLTFSTMMS